MIGRRYRYATDILYTDHGDEFLGVLQCVDTTPRLDDRFHAVVEDDRLDLPVHRYPDWVGLWWIICDYSDIFFPLEIGSGTVLRIPSVEHVLMRLLS